MNEPVYAYQGQLNRLDKKVDSLKELFETTLQLKEQILTESVTLIKKDVRQNLQSHIDEFNCLKAKLLEEVSNLKIEIDNSFSCQSKENDEKYSIIYNTVEALRKKISLLYFDIKETNKDLTVTYVNPSGGIETGTIKKIIPDEATLTFTEDGKLAVKQSFDKDNFTLSDSGDIKVKSLSLTNGKNISADRIQNDLAIAKSNLDDIKVSIEQILARINSINSYVIANNFGKNDITSAEITEFVLTWIKQLAGADVKKDQIPSGTKIKNTFDNHIWIFNRIKIDGLVTDAWADIGADNICTATNNGILGLVTGSQENLRGYIDINGIISINGLEEALTDLLDSMLQINNSFVEYKSFIDKQLSDLDSRLKLLES